MSPWKAISLLMMPVCLSACLDGADPVQADGGTSAPRERRDLDLSYDSPGPKIGFEAPVGSIKDGEVVGPVTDQPLAKRALSYDDVGVLEGENGTCPEFTTATPSIRMDDEDSDNSSFMDPYGWDPGQAVRPEHTGRSGGYVVWDVLYKKTKYSTYWDDFLGGTSGMVSSWSSNRGNTAFDICRIPGYNFRNARKKGDQTSDYAVFKLGSVCPDGAVSFVIHHDNEDNNNTNLSTGDVEPSAVWRNGNDKGYSRLQFCFFPAAGANDLGMNHLPWLRSSTGTPPYEESQYGVFAKAAGYHSAVYKFSWGYHWVDDEDKNCTTRLELSDAAKPYEARIRAIITVGKDRTKYNVGVAYAKPWVIF